MFNSIRNRLSQSKSESNRSSTRSNRGLTVEPLEPRLMLSTVEVFVAGETGEEAFNVLIDGEVAQTFENVGGNFDNRDFEVLIFETEDTVTADRIEIEFINDDFNEETGFDRNLFVDGIIVDGAVFETEEPTTFSTGFIDEDGFTGPGFLETEILNVDGKFSFLADGGPTTPTPGEGTRIRVDAIGETGEENLQLQIDGVAVADFQLDSADVSQSFFFVTDEDIDISQLRISFTNDDFDPATGLDRNVTVSSFQAIDLATADRQIARTTDANVFGNNSYTEADGAQPGFGRGGVLITNGFLEVREADGGGGSERTRIRVDALGETGEEILEIQVGGEVVGSFNVSTTKDFYLATVDADVPLEDVQIAFVNDDYDPAAGFDRNLIVSSFQVIDVETGERQVVLPTDSRVFSTGTYLDEDGVVSGFGRGDTLNVDGFFQFQEAIEESLT